MNMPKKNIQEQYTSVTQQYDEEVERNSTAIKLISQSIEYMNKGIEEIKQSISHLRDEISNGFVTKEQFERLKEEVVELKKMKDWAVKLVLAAVIVSLLSLILVK